MRAARCNGTGRRPGSLSGLGSQRPDGLDNNANFLGGIKFPVPPGFTREVTVLAKAYWVAYGRTASGIVNYTTLSGSNTFTGEVYGLNRPGRPLDARSPFPRRDLSGNPVGESFKRYQGGFATGGALKRGKTFFDANDAYTRDRNTQVVDAPQLGIVATVTGNNKFHLAPLRLDHRLTACACRAPEALTCGLCARRSAHRGPPSARLRSSQAVRP